MRRRYDFFVATYLFTPAHVHLVVSKPKSVMLAGAARGRARPPDVMQVTPSLFPE
jgi:hypothetical protein